MDIEFEKHRLTHLKNLGEMKLFDYIKAIRKKVSFYELFNALDYIEEQKLIAQNQDKKIKYLEMIMFSSN